MKMDTHKVPPTTFVPENYPANPNTHHISRYQPQDIEQPTVLAYNEDVDWDKLQLQEDRAMQEHYYWARVQNMWTFYVEQQADILGEEEFDLRKEQSYYPSECPKWWRQLHSHENMWKYGIWPQHSLITEPKHTRAKYARDEIKFTE